MAMKALAQKGFFDVIPDEELEHIEELKEREEKGDVDPGTAENYRKTKAATVKCKLLDEAAFARLQNYTSVERSVFGTTYVPKYGDAVLFACLRSIVDLVNFVDPDTNQPLEFKGVRDEGTGRILGAAPEDVRRLPGPLRDKVFAEVKRRCSVGELDFS